MTGPLTARRAGLRRTAPWSAALAFALALAGIPSPASAQVQTQSKMLMTKHNLSVSGLGPVRAATEQQLCVFCHTPHVPQEYAAQQLWNKQLSTADYTLYSSDYLTNLNYDAPNQPNARSKLCLACHDGTVAIGAVYNNRGQNPIVMQNDVTTIPEGAEGNLGTSLANDHPVGYVYNASKDPELVNRPWPWNTPVKLDPDLATGTVECMSCHDPHDDSFGKFLRVSNVNAALCTFCHQKAGWEESGHRTSIQAFVPDSGAQTTVGEWSCRNCHASHNGEGVPYLLNRLEENTCFESGCHGSVNPGPDTKDIQSALEKFYRHPTASVLGAHRNPDDAGSVGAGNRHAECQDCHNPHRTKGGLHVPGTNALSNVLAGVSGVQPSATPGWTQPTSFTELSPAVQENQVCFKCHSAYALGIVPDGVSTIPGPSGTYATDQSMEFNPANRSAHPVQASLDNQSGSAIPRALSVGQLTPEWGSAGAQQMYCSDCHGPDQQVSPTVPAGPHGSDVQFMLTGTGKYWPTNASGNLWSLNDLKGGQSNWQNDLFCANCHPMTVGGDFTNNVHEQGAHGGGAVKCITCHVAVPHGAKRSRLIGYADDPIPYNYQGAGVFEKLVIVGFRKASGPQNYQKEDCSMIGKCHGTQINAYEP